MKIKVGQTHFKTLNEQIRQAKTKNVVLEDCIGQRYIAAGMKDKRISIFGTPGNALGAYLDGASIEVFGNAQEATGDTMNEGSIIIHGSSGDATGYAMRGGKIFVQGDAGYRTGIHMKSYRDKVPVLVVGGRAGSFLGEYQAGGYIIVLGLNGDGTPPMGNFCGTGMHGGKIFLRCQQPPQGLPEQVSVERATEQDKEEIAPFLAEFTDLFQIDGGTLLEDTFYVLTPNTKNPYKRLYTHI